MEKRGRNLRPHPLPQRKLAHRLVGERAHVQILHELIYVLFITVHGNAVHPAQQFKGLPNRQIPPQLCLLPEDSTYVQGVLYPLFLGIQPADPHGTCRRGQDA